ncbi:MAG: carbon-nitrogen hydrolase [Candidatus Hinthialibacter sp.]
MSCSSDADENRRKAAARIEESARNGAQIVCLQELFLTPYFCQREDPNNFDLAEPIPGPSTQEMGKLAKSLKITIIASLFERRAPGLYHNTIAVINENGDIAGKYRKMHIPDDPGYYEKYYFTPGDLGFQSVDTSCGKVGPLICWDQWFPEAARLTALQGAHTLCYPTAIGWHPREKSMYGAEQLSAWRTIQRSHAIANGVYVAAINRVGYETPPEDGDGIEFWGSSFICDPFGVIIAEAPCDKEAILYAEIDQKRIENVRRNWPFLRDRRIDAYQNISERMADKSI